MAKAKGNKQKYVAGAFGNELSYSPAFRYDESREDRPFTKLNKPQLDVYNRFCELQNGCLSVMSDAAREKIAKISSKEAYEAYLLEYKENRGKMAPEEASDAQIRIGQLYEAKKSARDSHWFHTDIIIAVNNKFLCAFGVEIRKKEQEEHWERKQRTREVVQELIPEGKELQAISKFQELYEAASQKLQEQEREDEESEDAFGSMMSPPLDSTLAVLSESSVSASSGGKVKKTLSVGVEPEKDESYPLSKS
jgi:hypothetical protein